MRNVTKNICLLKTSNVCSSEINIILTMNVCLVLNYIYQLCIYCFDLFKGKYTFVSHIQCIQSWMHMLEIVQHRFFLLLVKPISPILPSYNTCAIAMEYARRKRLTESQCNAFECSTTTQHLCLYVSSFPIFASNMHGF